MNNVIAASLVGLLSGLHAASWGMYKDAPHEGFELRKYFRSVALGVGIGAGAGLSLPLDPSTPAGSAILFGLVYVVERALAEIYKTFLRQSDQSKYTIPMQFAVLGKPVASRLTRVLLGGVYLGIMLGMVALVCAYQRRMEMSLSLASTALIGSAGAWISAFGGAWKDAPFEGFQLLKFLRSPLLAAAWAVVLAHLTSDLVLVTLAATGYTIATTETYKTFLFPSRPRGKFAGKPVRFPDLMRTRNRVVPLYVGIWLAVLLSIGIGLKESPASSGTKTMVVRNG